MKYLLLILLLLTPAVGWGDEFHSVGWIGKTQEESELRAVKELAKFGKVCEYMGEHWWEEKEECECLEKNYKCTFLQYCGWNIKKYRICKLCGKKQTFVEEWRDD